MVDLWRTLEMERVLRLSVKDMLSIPGWLVGQNKRESIFPSTPIDTLLKDVIDWDQIHKHCQWLCGCDVDFLYASQLR